MRALDIAKEIVKMVVILMLGFSVVWFATHDTPERRAKIELATTEANARVMVQEEIRKKAVVEAQEKTNQMRIAAQNAPSQRIFSASSDQGQTSSDVGCAAFDAAQTRFWQPLRISEGCVTMNPGQLGYFWACFDAVPKSLDGISEIIVVQPGEVMSNGYPKLTPVEFYRGPDFAGFVQKNLGKSLFLKQSDGRQSRIIV